ASYGALLRSVVHPLWPYFACNYYIGNERNHARTVAAVFEEGVDALNLESPADAGARLRDLDSLYVPVQFFPVFVDSYLPLLKTRIILMTGQYMKPQLNVTANTDRVLRHPKIAHWFMQNAIYAHPKVTQIPYGIHHERLRKYAHKLHTLAPAAMKSGGVRLLPMNYKTHPSRQQLRPHLGDGAKHKLPEDQYLDAVAASYYVISPVGDRPETYRHWEAVGLQTIPVCNCPAVFHRMFQGSMFITDMTNMIAMLNASADFIKDMYHVPNRELILASYWRNVINRTRNSLQRR
ncbi:unnamed protein product, partial [Ectocarpus fasciculatus]